MEIDRILDFWRAYDRLSKGGACDSAGGSESRRVFAEWIGAGSPETFDDFIVRRANFAPRAVGMDEWLTKSSSMARLLWPMA